MADSDKVVSDEKTEVEKKGSAVEENNEAAGAQVASTSEDESREETKGKGSKTEEKLKKELAAAKQKADENWSEYLRACAELENTKRRMARDLENANKFAVEKFVQELLPVKDSLEMGLSAAKDNDNTNNLEKLVEGTELTLKMLTDAVGKFGVEEVNPVDEPFNSELHQAMSMQESSDKAPNTVLAVMQKGYTLQGRLIRPAMVIVAKAASKSEETSANAATGESSEGGDNADRMGTKIDEQA